MLSTLYSNKALSFLRLNCGEDALSASETALKFDPKSIKATQRMVLSLILLDRF